MQSNTYPLWSENEYNYPLTFGFIPNIVSYLHEEDFTVRPALLIVPGGGYCVVSPTEAEIVALEFYNKGYNTFVLTYTTNISMKEPLKLQPLKDLSRALRFIRSEASRFRIHPDNLAVCGFSAGGHLTASSAVHYDDIKDDNPIYAGISNRPDAVILSYPVITSGEMAHRGSFIALLGTDATKEELRYMSLENHVKPTTPPTFLWHTATDDAVPVENNYLFANACREQGVFYEQHVFSNGVHGLSLANELWYSGKFGTPYTMEQIQRIKEKVINGELEVSPELIQYFSKSDEQNEQEMKESMPNRKPDAAIAIWPVLADLWLKKVFSK